MIQTPNLGKHDQGLSLINQQSSEEKTIGIKGMEKYKPLHLSLNYNNKSFII